MYVELIVALFVLDLAGRPSGPTARQAAGLSRETTLSEFPFALAYLHYTAPPLLHSAGVLISFAGHVRVNVSPSCDGGISEGSPPSTQAPPR